MHVRCLVRSLLGAFLVCIAAQAQLDTGSVLGTVFDSSRAVVASARVVIENQGTAVAVESRTDAQGNFLVPVLPVGTYRVTVSSDGFTSQLKEDIRVRVSDRVRLVFSLEPGSVTETVTVTGQAPLVETASSTLGLVVETEQINALPLNGRNVSDLLHLVPGNVLRTQGTKQAFNGASLFRQQGGLRFLLDGGDASRIDFDILDNTYGSSKGRISRSSTEAIQEFRVYTNSYSAEFGQVLGGVVNLISKSGSNEMHGSLFEYFRNEKLDSRNYFNHTGQKPPFRLNQFGASLGGPIARGQSLLLRQLRRRAAASRESAERLGPDGGIPRDGRFGRQAGNRHAAPAERGDFRQRSRVWAGTTAALRTGSKRTQCPPRSTTKCRTRTASISGTTSIRTKPGTSSAWRAGRPRWRRDGCNWPNLPTTA